MPSRQQDFSAQSQRRWFAIGAVLWPPYRVPQPGGAEVLGCQTLAAIDVESQCFLHARPTARAPAPFSAAEILAFAEEIFRKHGRPREGLIISASAWCSTSALHEDPETRERVAELRARGWAWPEMDAGERLRLALRVQALGLALAWSEDQIPPPPGPPIR